MELNINWPNISQQLQQRFHVNHHEDAKLRTEIIHIQW